MIAAMILATLLTQNEDNLQTRAKPLIEKLRSDRIEEREQAHRELRKLGQDVLPLLRRLAQDRDLEFAGRIQSAIRAIDLREGLKAEARETGTVRAGLVLEWMSAESGRRILCAEDVGLTNRKVRIAAEAFENASAYELGVDLLKSLDVAAIPDPDDPKRVHLAPGPVAAKRALKTYATVDALPQVNEFCSLLLTIRNVSPREMQAVVINLISFPQNCLAIESGGKLLMSDYSSNLRKLGRLVEQMDLPRPGLSSRVSVALLAGSVDDTPSVPEPFRTLGLPELSKKNRFVILAEAFTRLEQLTFEAGIRRGVGAGSGSAVRITAEQPYVIEIEGALPHPAGLQVDRIALRSDAEADRKASPLLQTRLVLKKGEWMVAGSVPGPKEGTSLLLLLRAESE